MFQNAKSKWLAKKEAALESEFSAVLSTLEAHFDLKKASLAAEIEAAQSQLVLQRRDVEDLEKRYNDKKLELERKNQELAAQIRLIEAKAAPDEVWASAFQAGFTKCWEIMWEFQADQVVKLREKIKNQAINETLERLNGHSL